MLLEVVLASLMVHGTTLLQGLRDRSHSEVNVLGSLVAISGTVLHPIDPSDRREMSLTTCLSSVEDAQSDALVGRADTVCNTYHFVDDT